MVNNCSIVSAGGTGGHIMPALAVCKELMTKGLVVFYIGNRPSMEYDIISHHNINFFAIDVQKLYRSFTLKHFMFPFKLIKSIRKCLKYFRQIKPIAFIGFGGFVSGPPAVAAWMLKCPVFLQEQNARPGLTNLWTGKIAKAVFLAYEESRQYFRDCRSYLVGNPLLMESPPLRPSQEGNTRKVLLILGGSQGSLFINNLILEHLDWFEAQGIEIFWQTGKKHLHAIMEQVHDRANVFCFDFTNSIDEFYHVAGYVISRGGALSLAEAEVFRLPAFIIPLQTAAVNEQYFNAKSMEKRNMGICFEQKEKANFKQRFTEFMQKAETMYTDKKEPIHLSASENIVRLMMQEINWKTTLSQKPLKKVVE